MVSSSQFTAARITYQSLYVSFVMNVYAFYMFLFIFRNWHVFQEHLSQLPYKLEDVMKVSNFRSRNFREFGQNLRKFNMRKILFWPIRKSLCSRIFWLAKVSTPKVNEYVKFLLFALRKSQHNKKKNFFKIYKFYKEYNYYILLYLLRYIKSLKYQLFFEIRKE